MSHHNIYSKIDENLENTQARISRLEKLMKPEEEEEEEEKDEETLIYEDQHEKSLKILNDHVQTIEGMRMAKSIFYTENGKFEEEIKLISRPKTKQFLLQII